MRKWKCRKGSTSGILDEHVVNADNSIEDMNASDLVYVGAMADRRNVDLAVPKQESRGDLEELSEPLLCVPRLEPFHYEWTAVLARNGDDR